MVNPVAQALQPLQPFIWGRGGAKLTPEQIAREREIAEALGVVDMSPVDHWLQGAARLANAAVGRLRESRADRAERENASLNADIVASLLGGVGGSTAMTPALSGASPVAATAPSEPMDYASQRVAQAHAVGSGVLPPSFVAAIDRSEGGGSYDTLFSFANREGPFAGVDVSQMSIGDVMAFTDPSGPYAQFVKGKVGRVATPVGRHQIVGTTLRNAVQELGLDPSQPFDPATQDMIALHLAKKRVQSANTLPGKIAALRSEWEGFKSVPDDQMAQIVAEIEAAPVNAAGPVSRQALQAQLESLPVGGTMTMPTPDQMAAGSTQPSPVAMALAPQAAPPAPVQVAQAGGGINPAIIEALSSPYVNDQTRQIAGLLLQQQMQAQDPMRALELQIAQEKLNQLRNPQPEITAEMQNLQWRAAQAGLQPGTPEYAEFMLSGGKGPLVNVDVGGGEKFGEEFAKGDAQALAEVSQAGLAAQRNIARIDRLGEILAQTPQGAMASWQQIAGQYGINTEGLDNIQAAQALINSLVPEQRPPGSGPMSDADLELFKQSLPRIINQPNGNQIILNTMRAIAQYDAEGASIVQQLRRGEIDRATAFDMLQSRQNPLAGLDDISKRNRSSDAPPPGVDPADWEYMTPEERALFQ